MEQEYISVWEAFKYCVTTLSYFIWVAIGFLVFIGGLSYNKFVLGETHGWNKGPKIYIMIGCILFLLLTIIYRPSEISANTTKEQAARGVYIGY